MRIGAHVSTAEALDKSIDRARDIGSESIQIFACAPQSWRPSGHSAEAKQVLRRRAAECGIFPIYVHAIYLVNLASENETNVVRAIASLAECLEFCNDVDDTGGLIFHVGSHKGAGFDAVMPQIVRAMEQVLERAPGNAALILENSAGMGNTIAAKFSEIGAIVRAVGSPRVRVCLDTCHAFASGYDVAHAEGMERAMAEFDREIGLDRLVAVHANDSKAPFEGGKDRHENIGVGYIGLDGFRAFMHHPAVRNVPFLLEVPGQGKGPDLENVQALKQIREEVYSGAVA